MIKPPLVDICLDALDTERFKTGDAVSHNAGVIDKDSKRFITEVIGYDRNGGVQYRLKDSGDKDRGLAYDCELDFWPGDESNLPMMSPRNEMV